MRSLLNYYSEVLGIRQFIRPPVVLQNARLIFTHELQFETPAEKEIFAKMIQAMGLGNEDFLFVPFSFSDLTPFLEKAEDVEIIVSFSAKAEDFLRLNFPRKKVFVIPSPAEMLQKPNLKRGAWETLKSIIPLLK